MWPFKDEKIIITREEVIDLLPDADFIQVLDREYILPSMDDILEVLGEDLTTYIAETNDCDDFAYRAKGLASGHGWPFAIAYPHKIGHIMNMFISKDKQVMLLEPQTREVKKEGGQYTYNSIVI